MDVAIAETDGGDRDAVIQEFYQMLSAGFDDDDELLQALGEGDAKRYEAACDLFEKGVLSGARPKRGAPSRSFLLMRPSLKGLG